MIRQVSIGIYRGPRLLANEYHELVERKIGLVINLESNKDVVMADATECQKNHIDFFWEPMSEILPCSVRTLTKLAEKLEFTTSDGVYVHCRRGIDRTGQVIAAWRIMYDGYSFEQAYEEQVSFGHPELYNLVGWKWVLSRVKPVKKPVIVSYKLEGIKNDIADNSSN